MTMQERLENMMMDYPICEYAYGDPKTIPISDKVFTICETDCVRYKKSWACPPHAGEIQDNIDRIHSYDHFMIFSTVWPVSDSWNAEACLGVKKEHEALTREFRTRLLTECGVPMESLEENNCPDIYILSAGCSICEVCACPCEPCRHPKERLMTMESHGIVVMQMMEELGLTYTYDGTTVAYFTMVLWKEGKSDS